MRSVTPLGVLGLVNMSSVADRAVMMRLGALPPSRFPVQFTIGAAGQQAQPTRFLMNQTLLRVGTSWQIASILPIPAPTQ